MDLGQLGQGHFRAPKVTDLPRLTLDLRSLDRNPHDSSKGRKGSGQVALQEVYV